MMTGQPDPRMAMLLQLLQGGGQQHTQPQSAGPQTPGIFDNLRNGAYAMTPLSFGNSAQRPPSPLESVAGGGGMGGLLGALKGAMPQPPAPGQAPYRPGIPGGVPASPTGAVMPDDAARQNGGILSWLRDLGPAAMMAFA